MSDLTGLARQCKTFAGELAQAQRTATGIVAKELTDRVEAGTRSVAASGVLSGVGKRGARVGVKAEILSGGTGAVVRATGPYQLIERDTKAHTIPKQLDVLNVSRRKRQLRAGFKVRKPLNIPGIGIRRSVHHPGTHGQHPFEKAVNAYAPKASNVYQRQVAAAMQRSFR